MISVSGLSFSYDSSMEISFPGFSVEKGKPVLLLGESGSGKTTLLHILGGLLRKYSGSVKIDGIELGTLSEAELDRFRGQRIGYIFQRNHLIASLSVEKNLLLAPYLAGLKADHGRVTAVLETLGLMEKRNSRISALSQGQAQRVAIARAILNKPSILFADEPTSALDDKNCERVTRLLLDAASESNSTLVVATHDQRLKDKIGNRIELKPIIQNSKKV
jgi:ABC-type lipoprotein export system ATPase subunit